MKQSHFESKYKKSWEYLENVLVDRSVKADESYPRYYREICHQLALAKHRKYSPQLIDYLNDLVTRGHHHFYQHNYRYHFQWLEFFRFDLPNTIRRNWIFVAIASALFVLPLFSMGFACYLNSEFIYSIMDVGDVAKMEAMYNPENAKLGRERTSDTDIMMFGHYIQNNIGIGFRTFAAGIIYGLGSAFFLVFNGVFIGSVAGHLTQLGFGATFYPFVSGHGSFELTGIVFSGAAGLKLGYSLVRPGAYSIKNSLKFAGKDAITIMYGVIVMLLIAAFVEAFWSSTSDIPSIVKYVVGAAFWLLVVLYFTLSGRRNGS